MRLLVVGRVFAILAFVSTAAPAGTVFGALALGIFNLVTHANGYGGVGDEVTVEICIDATSANAEAMRGPLERVVSTWNAFAPMTGRSFLDSANVAVGTFDFETVLLHEVGHRVFGLDHINLESDEIFPPTLITTDLTNTDDGPNGLPNSLVPIGSTPGFRDNTRGDDINLHWFGKALNNPLLPPAVVDRTTYSRLLTDLPLDIPEETHSFAANANRGVAMRLGVESTRAAMYSLTRLREESRTLSADDVATAKLAMAGIDELAGTADDYTIRLVDAGFTPPASSAVILRFGDPPGGKGAVCNADVAPLAPAPGQQFLHYQLGVGSITFDLGRQWHFGERATRIFQDGFESGDSSNWSTSVP